MIQANELRIGNYVLNCNNEIDVITGVELGFKDEAEVCLLKIGHGEIDIKPIDLTTEILEKCGFVNIAGTSCYQIISNICDVIVYPSGSIELWTDVDSIKINTTIQYLHQLQNLVFALTGEEFDVKL